MLKEIEVSITLADHIVHKMGASLTHHGEPAASDEVDAYVQGLCRRVQINGCHMPRFCNAQGCFKKPVVHPDPIDYQLGAPSIRPPTQISKEVVLFTSAQLPRAVSKFYRNTRCDHLQFSPPDQQVP